MLRIPLGSSLHSLCSVAIASMHGLGAQLPLQLQWQLCLDALLCHTIKSYSQSSLNERD